MQRAKIFSAPSSLSDLGCRSEKSAGRGKISPDLQRQYQDIGQKAGEICTVQVILQPTTPKSDRLLVSEKKEARPILMRVFYKLI